MLTRAVNAFRKRRPKKSGSADQEGLASETETETEDCASSCRSEPIGRLNSDTSTVSEELAQLETGSNGGSNSDHRGRSRRFVGFTGSTSAASLLRLRSRSRSKDVGLAQSTAKTISNGCGGGGDEGSKNPECCVNCGGSGGASAKGGKGGKIRQKLRRNVRVETAEQDVTDGGSDRGTPTTQIESASCSESGGGGVSGQKTGVDWFDGFWGLNSSLLLCVMIFLV